MTDDAPKWLIVMTKAGAEHDVFTRLRKQGLRPWLWMQYRDESYGSVHHRRTRRVLRSYFSRYMFIRKTDRIAAINDTPGVATVLTEPGPDSDERRPLVIGAAEMRAVTDYLRVESDGLVLGPKEPPMEYLLAGDKVDVLSGPFESWLAEVEQDAPLDGREQIHAVLDLFGRKTKVAFSQDQVARRA